ncbi:MAG TPA: hypothetical protein VJ746_06175 [Nitrospira sp.]|nr:hypothetical protein [Nitrospira sp.]
MELGIKAQTDFTGRANPIAASPTPSKCTVDGCLHQADMHYEVTVTNQQLAPASETHLVLFCDRHSKAGDTLKWNWRRVPDATATPHLTLNEVFAVDTAELS